MFPETLNESAKDELIAALRTEIAALKARLSELERRLGLNSSNSGKPPSSDGPKKPARVRNLRERSDRKPGGQKGHEGNTLRQVADPDDVVDHYPVACSMCGAGLAPETSVGHNARQVFDLPERTPSSSPSIVRTIANAWPAARRRARRSRKASTRRCNMACGSVRSCCTFCTTSCCPRSVLPS